jgi:hypothetical protein
MADSLALLLRARHPLSRAGLLNRDPQWYAALANDCRFTVPSPSWGSSRRWRSWQWRSGAASVPRARWLSIPNQLRSRSSCLRLRRRHLRDASWCPGVRFLPVQATKG